MSHTACRHATADRKGRIHRTGAALAALSLLLAAVPSSWGTSGEEAPSAAVAGLGQAVVRVATEPEFGGGSFRFEGEPGGELVLASGEARSLSAEGPAPRTGTSTLVEIDPIAVAAGYRLAEIRCDDGGSAQPSGGNLENRTATFRIEDGETVTCVFVLTAGACVCPNAGSWRVTNNPGSMVCTGAVSMTMPLAPSRSRGTLEIRDGCETIIASGMSEDEETIVMHLQDDCGYRGSVGGAYERIPMVIDFSWTVVDSETITGDLHSEVSEQGMTCNMNRTYQLEYSGP